MILAIETATEACSAALVVGNEVLERYAVAPRQHNRLILPMIEELLAEAGAARSQISAVAFGRGPGSFTGVRIAAGVTQGIAFGLDCPVLPVSSLAALALQAFDEMPGEGAYACLDARMGEIYGAQYRRDAQGLPMLLGAEVVQPAAQVEPTAPVQIGIGSGWATYRETLDRQLGRGIIVLRERFPRAAHVGRLAALDLAAERFVAPSAAIPVYLRDQVARKPGG